MLKPKNRSQGKGVTNMDEEILKDQNYHIIVRIRREGKNSVIYDEHYHRIGEGNLLVALLHYTW